MTPADRDTFRRAAAGETVFEPVRVMRDGVERSFSVRVAHIADADGNVSALAFAGRDVTETQAQARRLGEREAQLLDALKIEALTRVIASAADDVEQFAASMEHLGPDGASEEARLEAERAVETARRLSAYTPARQAEGFVVLDEVVSRTERLLRQLVPRRILLEVQLDAPLAVTLGASELEEVLATLVVNAVDAIDGPGQIAIRTRTDRQGPGQTVFAVIEVTDSGAGMAPDVMARAFEPYFTTKAPAVGTGLGLASVRRLVTDSGGSIAVQSVVGQGTTFQVRLVVPPADGRPTGR